MDQIVTCVGTTYLDMPLSEMISQAEEEISTPASHPAREEEHPCTECGKPRSRRTTLISDPKVNAGRTYHPCTNISCRKGRANSLDNNWHLWECHGESPPCDCGLPSRQSRHGPESPYSGYGFWECAYGTCKYYSRDRKGRSVENGEVAQSQVDRFIPWLVNRR